MVSAEPKFQKQGRRAIDSPHDADDNPPSDRQTEQDEKTTERSKKGVVSMGGGGLLESSFRHSWFTVGRRGHQSQPDEYVDCVLCCWSRRVQCLLHDGKHISVDVGIGDSLETMSRTMTAQVSVHLWLVVLCTTIRCCAGTAPVIVNELGLHLRHCRTTLCVCAQCEMRKHSVQRLLGDECDSVNDVFAVSACP